MRTVAERLKWARIRAGYVSAAEAAEALGMKDVTVRAHENGTREPGKPNLRKYSARYKTPYAWLSNGDGSPDLKLIPVMGYVGAGAEVFPDGQTVGFEVVDPPPSAPPNCFALVVRGESRYPRYDPGDVCVFLPETPDIEALVGRDCVVDLEDGRRLLKRLEHGAKPGVYTLHSENAPAIRNVKIVRGARLKWVIRA